MRTLTTLLALCAAPAALAHGINGHVHVTGWAIEALPPGELADFFAEPEVRDAALIGAAFPDSGYAIGDPYGELAHWEPYVGAHLAWIQGHLGPPFETLEARKHVAFLMGLASHGLQDELFDSLFLYQVDLHDHEGQDRADPGTDSFLFADGWLQYKPPLYAPFDDLPGIFLEAHGHVVDQDTIRAGMNRVKLLVIDGFAAIAPGLEAQHRPFLAWTAEHYVDPAVPGSLASEIPPTAAYLQAIWDRLHDRYPMAAIATHGWPVAPRRLRALGPEIVDAWATIVFGAGVVVGSLNADTVVLLDPDGQPVPTRVRHTRWSGGADDSTRLVRIIPEVALAPSTTYTVELRPGIQRTTGEVLADTLVFTFESTCVEAPCAPEPMGGEPPRPPVVPDAGPPDAAVVDAAVVDAARPDAAPADAAPEDAARADMARPAAADAAALASDAAPADAAPVAGASGGDGCTQGPGGGGGVLGLLLGLALRRRRIRR